MPHFLLSLGKAGTKGHHVGGNGLYDFLLFCAAAGPKTAMGLCCPNVPQLLAVVLLAALLAVVLLVGLHAVILLAMLTVAAS